MAVGMESFSFYEIVKVHVIFILWFQISSPVRIPHSTRSISEYSSRYTVLLCFFQIFQI